MLGRIIGALRRRPVLGIGVSVAIHAALIAALVSLNPARTPVQKRGDALIVELPNLEEPANAGAPGPQAGSAPVPAPPAPKAPPTPPTPAAPPAPPRPRVATPPAPKALPKEAPREVAPRAVASAPQPPAATERGDIPAAKSAPQAPRETRAAPESPKPEAAPAAPPAVASPSPPPSPPGPVAMVPPPDLRSAFRRGGGGSGIGPGGAGGTGVGRGGILGEPIPLDSKDPDFSDYLERIRQLIKQNWGYPCVKNVETRECEYKSARLVVDFGILRHGLVQFVEVQRASGWAIYDDYAVNAIKLASPFPPVPAQLMARLERGSTGIPIRVNFTYMVETGITNVVR